ncbi:MAG TPA: nucleotidyltransferase domain-containing protein [Candidatus Bilamarchaeaceae archaeon]|nr:nucleotidyltransferase domain-containing protein [Candidatus Bilamarchaeaceae archaeon]
MLEKLFKSKTVVRILGSLLISEELHLREIARRAGITPIYVKKELENLRELGLASEARKGNLSIWSLDRGSPIYPDIRNMFFKTELAGNCLSETLRKFNPKYAFIFGSFAKGAQREGSDIDLFIVGKLDEDELIPAIAKTQRELGREINYILWSEPEFLHRKKARHSLLTEISRNPIIWLWGDEGGFRRTVAGKSNREGGKKQ